MIGVGAPGYLGAWTLGGTLAVLVAFFLLRGRIRIEQGWAGFALVRFTLLERLAHWLLALSFLVVAASAFVMLSGSSMLSPLVGARASQEISRVGLLVHGPALLLFMPGLLLAFLLWVRECLPHWRDVVWLLKGGGLVSGWHPPAWKFNPGQKLLFWVTLLGGIVLSVSGIVLAFPSQAGSFAKMLSLLNAAGLPVPAQMTPAEETRLAAEWHGAAALALVCIVLVHAYFRTIGIQGAASAMGSGNVDANWARQHHRLWADQHLKDMEDREVRARPYARAVPNE